METKKTYQDGDYTVSLNSNNSIAIRTAAGQRILWAKDIQEPQPWIVAQLKKIGKNPADYIQVDNYPVRKAAQYVIEAAIATKKAEESAEKEKDQKELDIAVKSGEAVMVLESAAQYGMELTFARRLRDAEKSQYVDWFQTFGMIGFAAAPRIKVKRTKTIDDIIIRKADGEFLGCDNTVRIITQSEWDAIVAEQAVLPERKPYVEPTHGPGYCYNCESYCYGDCGNYQPERTSKMIAKEANAALAELNYGIND